MRRGVGGEQVEGRRAVRELLSTGGRSVREVWIAQGLGPSALLSEIERIAARRRVRVCYVGRKRLEASARTESPQGVLAFASQLEETDLEELCGAHGGQSAFLLVLDGISDPHNLGALLRSAECAGLSGVVLARHRAAHVSPTVAKVASGAIEHLRFAVVAGVPNALVAMRRLGVYLVGLDARSEESLFALGDEVLGPVALVLGAEGRGLAALTRRRCDVLAAIPQKGSLESLNVSAAGAIACFELARRRSQ